MAKTPLVLPSLRGSFGSWIFYSCLMPIDELSTRVRSRGDPSRQGAVGADPAAPHRCPRKSDRIYLASAPDRFFNSLVLATYAGAPEWLEVGNFRSSSQPKILMEISERARDSIGFLRLSGTEKIFALDGQHRLAGIRQALADGTNLDDDLVPVLLVGHKKDKAGKQRTRRLFTTLNKTAIPVQKADIIALDEDDAMAIIARRLVEENASLKHPKVAVISSTNMPVTNHESMMTISSLYDVLKICSCTILEKLPIAL
jgi:DNA sulfur modification protein DndB